MSRQNVELLRRYYEAWNRDALAGVRDFWAEDFEWHDAPEIPDGGVFRGAAEVTGHFQELADAIGRMPVTVLEITPGPDEVLAALDVHVSGSSGGVALEGPIYEAVQIRDGKLSRIRLFLDRAQALEAVGLSE
jgi:ketosteroid isomerase-like protein